MKNWKTSAVAGLKVVGAIAFVVYKQWNHLEMNEAEQLLVSATITSAIGLFFAADAKKKDGE